MAWVLDLGQACAERRLEYCSWVVGTQYKPGIKPWLLVIGCIVGELDAQMAATGKADDEHRLVDAWVLDGSHRAAQDRLKAPGQFLAPVRAKICTLLPRAIMA